MSNKNKFTRKEYKDYMKKRKENEEEIFMFIRTHTKHQVVFSSTHLYSTIRTHPRFCVWKVTKYELTGMLLALNYRPVTIKNTYSNLWTKFSDKDLKKKLNDITKKYMRNVFNISKTQAAFLSRYVSNTYKGRKI